MVKEAPGPINFTVFLTMFGEKLKGEVGWRAWTLGGDITHLLCPTGPTHRQSEGSGNL